MWSHTHVFEHIVGWWFDIFSYFRSIIGELIQFDIIVFNGLKPPTSFDLGCGHPILANIFLTKNCMSSELSFHVCKTREWSIIG